MPASPTRGQPNSPRAAGLRHLCQVGFWWSRLGSFYSPSELRSALECRKLLELRALLRPAEDLALYRADMADWPGCGELRDWQRSNRGWVEANDACRRNILERLELSGPLTTRP